MGHEEGDKVVRQICADAAVVTRLLGRAYVAMVRRIKEPTDVWVLPGGHEEDTDGRAAFAARRELFEETFLIVSANELRAFDFLDAAPRDPRPGTPRVSVVFLAEIDDVRAADGRAGDGVLEFRWIPLDTLTEDMVGFDHWQVIQKLQTRYRQG